MSFPPNRLTGHWTTSAVLPIKTCCFLPVGRKRFSMRLPRHLPTPPPQPKPHWTCNPVCCLCITVQLNKRKRRVSERGMECRKWTRGGVWDQNDFLNASLPLAAIKQSTVVISSAQGAQKETLLNPNGGTWLAFLGGQWAEFIAETCLPSCMANHGNSSQVETSLSFSLFLSPRHPSPPSPVTMDVLKGYKDEGVTSPQLLGRFFFPILE